MRRLPGNLRIVVALATTIHNFDTKKDLGRAPGAERGGSRIIAQQAIYQTVRQRVNLSPLIQVDLVVVRDFTICTERIARGEEPLYFLDGVVFLRYGESDIKAEPEIVKRLLMAYAI